MRKRILLICDANLPRAPRVINTYLALNPYFEISMAGYEKPAFDVEYIALPKISVKKRNYTFHHRFPTFIRKPISLLVKTWIALINLLQPPQDKNKIFFELLKEKQFDLIINHHLSTLEAAVNLKRHSNVPLILNLHEYYPLEFESVPGWIQTEGKVKFDLCSKFLPEADNIFVVCQGIADKYEDHFAVKSTVIRNDKKYNSAPARISTNTPLKAIHHGAAMRVRELEKTIEAFKTIENVTLDLMLTPLDSAYLEELKGLVEKIPNINIIDPVPYQEIIPRLLSYDIGVFLLNDKIFNYRMALPNKLFEFIQAKLAIVITPNPEMKRIVETYDLGIVSPSYSIHDFQKSIAQLDVKKVNHFKKQCEKHAHELSSEVTQKRIFEEVSTVLKNHN